MVLVNVTEGVLEGEQVQNEYGGTFYSFKGIPYAQPPVGDLRFKAPQLQKPWEGILSAKQFGSKCYQYDMLTNTGVQGTEDCLYLNVYTPELSPDKPLPVMFWIHGGGLICGSGEDDIYGPEYLVKQGVILVTINYRLEVLGFLCLNSEDVPGNAGLKDQVAALRWVNKNISKFGGDPNNVTIFGESAGGASVSYHLVSPMSKGLFKRAITQSGVSFCPWAQTYEPRDRALALARQLGCYAEGDKELYEFFKTQPVEKLALTSVPILLSEKARLSLNFGFSVVAEKEFANTERFFGGDFTSFHENVEIMIGHNTDEGIIFLGPAESTKPKLEMAIDFPEFFVSKPLAVTLTTQQQLELGKKIRKFYFNDKTNVSEDWERLAKFYAMDFVAHPVMRFAKSYSKSNDVYFYKFSCKTERNILTYVTGLAEIVGEKPVTNHADDLLYLFNAKLIPTKVDINSDTFQVMDRVVKLWTNFAKYGNPTPDISLGVKWPKYTIQKQGFLDIGNKLVAGTAPDAEEHKFWDSIYEQYGQKLY